MKNKKEWVMGGIALAVVVAIAVFSYYSEGDVFQGRLAFFKQPVTKVDKVQLKNKADQTDKLVINNTQNGPVVDSALDKEISPNISTTKNFDILTQANEGSGLGTSASSGNDTEWPEVYGEPTIVSFDVDPNTTDLSNGAAMFRYRMAGFEDETATMNVVIYRADGAYITTLQEIKNIGNGVYSFGWYGDRENSTVMSGAGTYDVQLTGETSDGKPIAGKQIRVTLQSS